MENIPLIEQPENLDVDLFVHQLASVYAMEKMEKDKFVMADMDKLYTDVGINADITGYGKTISMVALVLRDKMEWNMQTEYTFEHTFTYASQHVKKICIERYPRNNSTLVLAGPSILHQWAREFSHTNLRYVIVSKRKEAIQINIDEYDVIIISPNVCNILLDRYEHTVWKRFIYDEPTTVRVPAMRPIRAGFTWFVTATPGGIYPHHKNTRRNYISNIVGDRNFEYFIREYVTVKNPDEFVFASFAMPPTHTVMHRCTDNIFRAVYGIVNDRISKMIEAGHIFGAVQALGGKKTDNIIELVKKNKIIELEEIRSKIKIWKLRADEEKVKEWEDKEKSVVTQIGELDKRFSEILNDNCTICYEKLSNPIMEPGCHNIFCGTCLLTWLKDKGNCPMCRRIINRSELVYIDIGGKEEKKYNEEKEKEEKILTKDDAIVKIIKEKKDGKIIVFSDWNDTFEAIRHSMVHNGINYVEITGTAEMRRKKLEKFENGEVKVVFLNSKTDSSGINMQQTTDIILYHSMEDRTRQQILGRANRIGRKIPLTVHQLISV